jgi:hypothetical protein
VEESYESSGDIKSKDILEELSDFSRRTEILGVS